MSRKSWSHPDNHLWLILFHVRFSFHETFQAHQLFLCFLNLKGAIISMISKSFMRKLSGKKSPFVSSVSKTACSVPSDVSMCISILIGIFFHTKLLRGCAENLLKVWCYMENL